MSDYDYRTSHQKPGKGASYDTAIRSGRYRGLVWAWEKRILDGVLRTYYLHRRIQLLDFACGTGRIISFLEEKVESATGVDVSESMLSITAGKVNKSDLLLADLTEEDVLSDRQFNLITAFRFFLNAQPSLGREVMRILSDHLAGDGYLIFNNHLQRGSLMHLALSLWAKFRGRERCRSLSANEVKELLSGAGLRVAATHHWGLLPANDRRMPMPAGLLAIVEGWAGRCRLFRPLAQNVIYICAKLPATRHSTPGPG